MRIFEFKLDSAVTFRKTDEGFLVIPTRFSRIGIQTYGDKKELRLPEDVFNEDSMNSFVGKPVTFTHPKEGVDVNNWKRHEVGTILKFDKEPGDVYTTGEIIIKDKGVIEYIEKRRAKNLDVQMSCGYKANVEDKCGEWDGDKYDGIQRDIRGNHVAIVSQGRAGQEVAMRLDENNKSEVKKMKFKLDSIPGTKIGSVEMNTDSIEDVSNAVIERDKQFRDELVKRDDAEKLLKKEKDETQAKLDSEIAEKKKLEVQLADESRLDAIIAEKTKIKECADYLKIKVDGLDKMDLKKEIIKKVFEDADLTDKSDDYVNARFDSAVDMISKEKKIKTIEVVAGKVDEKGEFVKVETQQDKYDAIYQNHNK